MVVLAPAAAEFEADAEFVDEHRLAVAEVVVQRSEHGQARAADDADVGLVGPPEGIESFAAQAPAEAVEAMDRIDKRRIDFERAVGQAAAEQQFAAAFDVAADRSRGSRWRHVHRASRRPVRLPCRATKSYRGVQSLRRFRSRNSPRVTPVGFVVQYRASPSSSSKSASVRSMANREE